MALGKSISVPSVADTNTDRALNTIVDAVNELRFAPVVNSVLVPGVVIASGTTVTVNHGLGRSYRGRIVVAQSAEATIWDGVSATPDLTLLLTSNADVTVSLLVF